MKKASRVKETITNGREPSLYGTNEGRNGEYVWWGVGKKDEERGGKNPS